MKENKDHYTVQGHSRSPILVPIESLYTIDFLLVIYTNLHQFLSHTVSELLQIIGQIFAVDMRYTLVQGDLLNSGPRNVASRN